MGRRAAHRHRGDSDHVNTSISYLDWRATRTSVVNQMNLSASEFPGDCRHRVSPESNPDWNTFACSGSASRQSWLEASTFLSASRANCQGPNSGGGVLNSGFRGRGRAKVARRGVAQIRHGVDQREETRSGSPGARSLFGALEEQPTEPPQFAWTKTVAGTAERDRRSFEPVACKPIPPLGRTAPRAALRPAPTTRRPTAAKGAGRPMRAGLEGSNTLMVIIRFTRGGTDGSHTACGSGSAPVDAAAWRSFQGSYNRYSV